jgi:hypothetical protein
MCEILWIHAFLREFAQKSVIFFVNSREKTQN